MNQRAKLALGPRVRQALGPFEAPAARLYRAFFLDLARLAEEIRAEGGATSILEIGCGEGSLTEEIARRFPESNVAGIDISDRVGRLFRGDRTRVAFRKATIEQVAGERPAAFDLVLLADVLHHVRPEGRRSILEGARRALRPQGLFVVKEWERRAGLVHALAWLGDRLLTGDRVQFLCASDLRNDVEAVFGKSCVAREARIQPWRNNLVLFVRVRA
jgi:2-polyprenyl-6-hydroxyphenyl methylase/3-demethylubiquinone-9 3-methyltransferase